MKKIFALIIVLGLIGVAIFWFSRTQKVVNEPLPELSEVIVPIELPEELMNEVDEMLKKSQDPEMSSEEKMNMELEIVKMMNDESKSLNSPKLDILTDAEMSAQGVEKKGFFTGVDSFHQALGTALLFPNRKLVRLENFSVTRGPDLRVSAITKTGERLDLGALKGNAGNQNYSLPANTSPDSIETIEIWCRAFNFTFARADLQ